MAFAGDLAANRFRAETRLTDKTELLVDAATFDSAQLEDALHAEGWRALRISADGSLKRFIHSEFGCADLIRLQTDFERAALSRSRRELLPSGVEVPVPRPEDAILLKLISGTFADTADVESIFDASPALDSEYLERQASELGIAAVLRGLLQTSRE